MRILITGGAGFIGSAAVRYFVGKGDDVLNVDKLTYAGNLRAVENVASDPHYQFIRADIVDHQVLRSAFYDFQPEAVLHLAAESHVDRSIDSPMEFVKTNVLGTTNLLIVCGEYLDSLRSDRADRFRFVCVSTDEVFGSLGKSGLFSETSPYSPRSPYAASKAAADHLTKAWHNTYGFPGIVSNCSNNYGPFQHGEKFIPTVIRNALAGTVIPVYGNGSNVRDWLFVDDHVDGLQRLLRDGVPGRSYNFGGHAELDNRSLADMVCAMLDSKRPMSSGAKYGAQIQFAPDRPGHDFRYAVDTSRSERELGWEVRHSLDEGLEKTVEWYLANPQWLAGETAK